MPAKSEAQRRYLNAHFGHAWVKAHHFDNKGALPRKAGGGKAVKKKDKDGDYDAPAGRPKKGGGKKRASKGAKKGKKGGLSAGGGSNPWGY